MTGKERLEYIRLQVRNERKVMVSDLSVQYEVTEETIRRDLEKLENMGVVTRIHGGAVLNVMGEADGVHLFRRATMNAEAKKEIARKTVELLKDVHSIVADASSTVSETLRLLRERDDLTIVTNSTEALHELRADKPTLVSTGGVLNKKSLSLQGINVKRFLEFYNLDIALISCKGFDENGAQDSNDAEAEVKRSMIAQSKKVALLIDHTKIGRPAFAHLISLDDIDYVITDKPLSATWKKTLTQQGITVID